MQIKMDIWRRDNRTEPQVYPDCWFQPLVAFVGLDNIRLISKGSEFKAKEE